MDILLYYLSIFLYYLSIFLYNSCIISRIIQPKCFPTLILGKVGRLLLIYSNFCYNTILLKNIGDNLKKKVAIFVDWDNLRKDIAKIQNYSKHTNEQSIIDFQKTFDYNNSLHIIKLIEAFLENDEEIYRIFFYTAKPKPIEEILNICKEFTQKEYPKEYESYVKYVSRINKFLETMGIEPNVAMRLGVVKCNEQLDKNNKFIFGQKQVDMLIGLDIAHVSYQKLVDKVILFSKDSDMKPVLKVARTNGLMVIIPTLKESRHRVTYPLQLHSDLIREKSITEVLNSLKNEVFLLGN